MPIMASRRWPGSTGVEQLLEMLERREVRTAELGYGNLQHSFYGYESTLVQQLDDTIARAVIEAEEGGQDVFRALLTTRTWRLASNLANTNGQACSGDDDCAAFTGYTRCQDDIGLCSANISNSTSTSLSLNTSMCGLLRAVVSESAVM